MKSVLMLYPTENFVEWDGRVRACTIRTYWDKIFGKGSYDERTRLINRLLDQYREKDFRVAWGLFSSERDRSVPDESGLSKVFEIKPEDLKLPVGITAREMIRPYSAPVTLEGDSGKSRYPDAAEVLQRLSPEELVVGGFHSSDCVRKFVQAGNGLGIPSRGDYLLTEGFFASVFVSFTHDIEQMDLDSGHLDPEMHEDDPLEDKRRAFDNRLDEWLS